MKRTRKVTRKKHDKDVRQVLDILQEYKAEHPHARIDAYRRNPASIRIRIIDPAFKGLDWVQRDEPVWAILDRLPEEVRSDISMLVLVTPQETKKSGASLEFEDPSPSLLD